MTTNTAKIQPFISMANLAQAQNNTGPISLKTVTAAAVNANNSTYDPYIKNVAALYHFDLSSTGGANTALVDAGPVGNALTVAYGTPTVSIAQSRFGGSSLAFPSTSSAVATNAAISFGVGAAAAPFTIEFWLYPTNLASNPIFVANVPSPTAITALAAGNWMIAYSAALKFIIGAGTGTATVITGPALTASVWSHVAVVCTGAACGIFVNGVSTASTAFSAAIESAATNKLYIGAGASITVPLPTPAVTYAPMQGYIDELRVTLGVARYPVTAAVVTSFVPQSTAFANYNSTLYDPYLSKVTLLLHCDDAAASDSSILKNKLNVAGAPITSANRAFGTQSIAPTTTAYVQTGYSPNFSFGTGSFTNELWFYLNSGTQPTSNYIIGNTSNGAYGMNNWMVTLSNITPAATASYKLITKIYNNNLNAVVLGGSNVIAQQSWHHFALVRNSNIVGMYLDGRPDGTPAIWSGSLDGGLQSNLLSFGSDGASNLSGYVDEVRITKGVARYTSNFAVPTAAFPGQIPLSSFKSYNNLYNPTVCLDTNVYTPPATGTVGTWIDLSGNCNNFIINSNAAFQSNNGINYMNFGGGYGGALTASGVDVPFVYNNGATLIAFSQISPVNTAARTLFAGTNAELATIQANANALGMYNNTTSTFYSSGFDVSTIPASNTNFNMYAIKTNNTTVPYYQFKYNNQTSNNYYANTASTAGTSQFASGIRGIGSNTQKLASAATGEYWGNVGLVLMYNTLLSEQQIGDIYNRFAPRFVYNTPPVTSNLIGYYTGESWVPATSTWLDISGSANHVTATNVMGNVGVFTKQLADSTGAVYQSLNSFKYLGGGIGAGITFPAAIMPPNYTLFWVARYAGSNLSGGGAGSRNNIFDASTSTPANTWTSGFYGNGVGGGGYAGVTKHNNTWITQNTSDMYGNNWIIGSDQTNLFRANASNMSSSTFGTAAYATANATLTINKPLAPLQRSDWMVGTVLAYGRELSFPEIQTVEFWLAQKYNINAKMHTLDKISSSAAASCVGAYSFTRVSSTYNGPTFRIRRGGGGDGALLDVYADINGNIGTAPNATGQSINSWLTVGGILYTACVDTWYDQSGNGNHAYQGAGAGGDGITAQPFLNLAAYCVDFSTNAGATIGNSTRRMKLPDGTVPSGNSAYTVVIKHGAVDADSTAVTTALKPTFLSSSPAAGIYVNDCINTFSVAKSGPAAGTYRNSWNNDDNLTGNFAVNNVVTFKYNGTAPSVGSRTTYVNGTAASPSIIGTAAVRNSVTTNNYIGYGDMNAGTLYMNGQLLYMYIFNAALSDQDRGYVEGKSIVAVLPAFPQSSIVTNLSYTSMTVNWPALPLSTAYVIVTWTATDGVSPPGASTAQTGVSYNITGLVAGVAYNIAVVPYNTLGIAGVQNVTATVQTKTPIVTFNSVISLSINSFTATFTPGVGSSNLLISWANNAVGSTSGNSNSGIIATIPGTQASYRCPEILTPANVYTVTLTPQNASLTPQGGFTANNTASNITILKRFAMPATFTSGTITSSNITYNFSGGDVLPGYGYFNGTAGASSSIYFNGNAGTTTLTTYTAGNSNITYQNLTPNTTYTIAMQVNALTNPPYDSATYSLLGNPVYNCTLATATLSVPSTPVTGYGTNSLTVGWASTTTPAPSYSAVVVVMSGNTYANSTTATTATFNGLLPNVGYSFVASAYNNSNVVYNYSPVTYITLPTVSLPTPSAVPVASAGGLVALQTATVLWNAAGTPATFTTVTISGGEASSAYNQSGTTATVTNLIANKKYTFTVTPYNSLTPTPMAGPAISTNQILTYPYITGVNANLNGLATTVTTQANMSWAYGTTFSTVRVTSPAGTVGTLVYGNPTGNVVISGLTVNTNYTFSLFPINSGNVEGITAITSSITTFPSLASATSSLTGDSTSTASVSWAGPGSPASWTSTAVTISNGVGGAPGSVTGYTATSATTTSITGLSPNVLYTFTVTPYNSASPAVAGSPLTTQVTTAPRVSGQGTSMPALTSTTTSLNVNWTAAGNPASFGSVVISGSGTYSSYYTGATAQITGLVTNTSYTFSLRPYSGSAGNGTAGPIVTCSGVTYPSVSGVSVSAISYTTATVSWTGAGTPATFTSVAVVVSNSSSVGNGTVGTYTATSVPITGLVPNITYTFTVTPYNSATVAGTASAPTGTTAAYVYTAGTVTVDSVTTSSVTVHYSGGSNANGGSTSPTVTLLINGGGAQTPNASGGATFGGLSPNSSYTFTASFGGFPATYSQSSYPSVGVTGTTSKLGFNPGSINVNSRTYHSITVQVNGYDGGWNAWNFTLYNSYYGYINQMSNNPGTFDGLAANITYIVRVNFSGFNGNYTQSSYYTDQSVTTNPQYGFTAGNISVTGSTSSSISVRVDNYSGGFSTWYFSIYDSSGNNLNKNMSNNPGTFSGLSGSTTYTIYVTFGNFDTAYYSQATYSTSITATTPSAYLSGSISNFNVYQLWGNKAVATWTYTGYGTNPTFTIYLSIDQNPPGTNQIGPSTIYIWGGYQQSYGQTNKCGKWVFRTDRTFSYSLNAAIQCNDSRYDPTFWYSNRPYFSFSQNDGFVWSIYNGYFNDDPTFFDRTGTLNNGRNYDFNNINSSTSSQYVYYLYGQYQIFPNNNTLFSLMYYGDLLMPFSDVWEIAITSDDASYIWIGNAADYDYNTIGTSSALINNGGLHGANRASTTIFLTGGQSTSFRVMYGQNYGDYNISISFRSVNYVYPTINGQSGMFIS